jgi:MFS family permease
MFTGLRKWIDEVEPWYSAIALANLTMGTSSVLLPLMISKVLHDSVAQLGYLSSLVSIMGVIGSLIWGRLSDRAHRRKPFVVLSFAAVSIGFAAAAFAPSFNSLLLINMIVNFFWVANISVTVLIVIENREELEWDRKISHLNQIVAIGWAAGLVFGSFALACTTHFLEESTAIRALFVILSLGSVGAVLLSLRLIPRTIPRFTKRRFRGTVTALGNLLIERARFGPTHLYHRLHPRRLPALLWGKEGLSRETKLFILAGGLAFTAFGFVFIPLPLLMSEYFGFTSSIVFLYYMVHSGAIVLAYPYAERRIRKAGNKSIQLGSVGMRLILFAGAAIFLCLSSATPPHVSLVAFFILTGISWSFFHLSGVTFASRLARPRNRGQVLGLYTASAGLGSIIAGVSSGYIAEYVGYWAVFAVAAVALGLSIVILYGLPRAPENQPR